MNANPGEEMPPEENVRNGDNPDLAEGTEAGELRPNWDNVLGGERMTEFWKDGPIQTFQEFLKNVRGIRFSTIDDVNKFVDEIESDTIDNPFSDGIVVFVPVEGGDRRDIEKFHDAFEELISWYATDIRMLVYCMFNCMGQGDVHYEKQLENICRLPNLESLAIYHGAHLDMALHHANAASLYKGPVYRNAPKLKELLIFPFMDEDFRPGSYFPFHLINYLALIPNFFVNLKCLQFPWKRNIYNPDLSVASLSLYSGFNDNLKTTLIPNLEKLKITLYRDDFDTFTHFCKPEKAPNLQQVGLSLGPMHGNKLGNAMKFLDSLASSLESIYINFDKKAKRTAEDHRMSTSVDVPFDWSLEYPKLKEAIIGFPVFDADDSTTWKIIREKFKQLKILTQLETRRGEGVPSRPLSYNLAFWETLPATLEEIRVPHQNKIWKRGDLPPSNSD